VLKDYNALNEILEEIDKSHDKATQNVEEYFHQLREILNFKEKELKLSIDHIFAKKKNAIRIDIQNTENLIASYDSLMDLLKFSMSFQNTVFVEGMSSPSVVDPIGTKYLFSRIDKIINSSGLKRDIDRSPIITHILNLEECKAALYKLSLPGKNLLLQ